MKMIRLNKEIPQVQNENMEEMISELVERDEMSCTGNVSCVTAVCGVKDI